VKLGQRAIAHAIDRVRFEKRRMEHHSEHLTSYRAIQIDGSLFFTRRRDPKDAPRLLRLHGFPPPSRMFAQFIRDFMK